MADETDGATGVIDEQTDEPKAPVPEGTDQATTEAADNESKGE